MTKPKRYQRYSSEFKREAILRAGEEGKTDKAVCDELGISTRQFRRWRDELELLGKDAFAETSNKVSPFDHFTAKQVCSDLAKRLG